jgi:hypothetical protein
MGTEAPRLGVCANEGPVPAHTARAGTCQAVRVWRGATQHNVNGPYRGRRQASSGRVPRRGPDVRRLEPLLTIGVGADVRVDLALGCDGWKALLGADARVGADGISIGGAMLASCLGANAAIRSALGARQLPAGSLSLWDRCRQDGQQGPREAGPVDVGRVLQAGAGAVGCALDFFMSFIGIGGAWTIADGDVVDVSNLNRQLLFVARDAGFPDGEPVEKAVGVAQRLGDPVSASPQWYGEDAGAVEARYDVVLALANDRGVRSSLQGRQPTVLLHATTSRSWEARLHRHVAGRDDCIDCRLPPDAGRFTCAEGEVQAPAGERGDAALPPLLATAGLLLAAELQRLELGGLVDERHNFTAVGLSSPTPTVQRKIHRCSAGCRSRRPAVLRQMVDAGAHEISRFPTRDAHSRWLHLDGDDAARL